MLVRAITPSDIPQIYQFICDLAVYEKAVDEVRCDKKSLRESLFHENPVAFGLIVEQDLKAVGFAIYFYSYSTWEGAKGLYLEDLYVDPSQRGKGAGKLLMQSLAKIAIEQDCKRFEWSVLDWNRPSIQFYQSIGAKAQDEWIKYRLQDECLYKLATRL